MTMDLDVYVLLFIFHSARMHDCDFWTSLFSSFINPHRFRWHFLQPCIKNYISLYRNQLAIHLSAQLIGPNTLINNIKRSLGNVQYPFYFTNSWSKISHQWGFHITLKMWVMVAYLSTKWLGLSTECCDWVYSQQWGCYTGKKLNKYWLLIT